MNERCTALLLSGLLIAMAGQAQAEDEISADRPGLLLSSSTVGEGRYQIEVGANYQRDKQGGLRTQAWTTPAVLRYGVSDDLELRLESDAFTRLREDDRGLLTKQSGFADTVLAVKWHDRDGDAKLGQASTAWWLSVELPSGSRDLKGDGLRPALYRVMEWELSEADGVAVMPGIKYDRDSVGHFWSGVLGAAYSRKWSDRLGMAVAWEGQQLASARHGGKVVDLNLAFTYLASKDWLLDAAASFGLNDHTPDLAVTLGLSLRL